MADGYKGGAYGDVTEKGIEAHHMPAQEAAKKSGMEGWTANSGAAIQMDPEDHAKTMSNGKMPGSREYRDDIREMISRGDTRGAMATEIRDVRRAAKEVSGNATKYNGATIDICKSNGRYNGATRQAMDYSRRQGFVPKNPQTKVKRTK
jgi:hypothetical protein